MKKKVCRSILLVVGILSLILVAPLKGNSAIYETDLTFATSDQSMWGAGDAIVWNYEKFIGPQWDESGSIGGTTNVTTPSITIIPEICFPFIGCTPAVTIPAQNLGTYGLVVGGSTNGEVGFDLAINFDSGSVDVTYPVGVSIDYPDPKTIRPGETFTISTAFDADPAASMETNFPEASLALDFIFDVYADAYGTACVVSCLGGTFFNVDVDETIPLINIDSNTSQTEFSILGGLTTMTAQVPDINTAGSLGAGDSISSSGEDFLLDVYFDVDLIATTLLGLPPLGGELDLGVASVSYEILNVLVGAILQVTQDFLFEPSLMLELALDTGEIFDLAFGESIDLVMPNSPLEITPSFRLDNIFTNLTGLRIDPAFMLELLSLSAWVDFPGVVNALGIPDPSLNLGPLYSFDASTEGPAIPIINRDWELQGFPEFTTASFQVVPAPEPATLLLLGSGLIGLGVFGRKRMKRTGLAS